MTPKAQAILNGMQKKLAEQQRIYHGFHRRAHEDRAEQLAKQHSYATLSKAIARLFNEYDNGFIH